MVKRPRILTHRYPNGSWEAIELASGPNGTIYQWIGDDEAVETLLATGELYPAAGWSFPVPEWFVKEKFEEFDRNFDPSKIPNRTEFTIRCV